MTASIHFGSGRGMTATSRTASWVKRASSTSREETTTPPLLMMSFLRSTIVMKPSSSMRARSPEWNQPPSKASVVSSGFSQ
ncbi:MAG TPA: hypothetical protein VF407_00460 [Polyangiaceae bacterium]